MKDETDSLLKHKQTTATPEKSPIEYVKTKI